MFIKMVHLDFFMVAAEKKTFQKKENVVKSSQEEMGKKTHCQKMWDLSYNYQDFNKFLLPPVFNSFKATLCEIPTEQIYAYKE